MPLSADPVKRERQLANLRPKPENLVPGAGAWNPGDTPHLVNGARTRRPARVTLDPIVEELAAVLGDSAPVRDPDTGGVPAADTAAIESAAVDVLIVRRLHSFLAQRDWRDSRGRPLHREIQLLSEANERLARKLDRLGMTPVARAKLGLDLARTRDVAVEWADATAAEDAEGAIDGEAEER